MSFLQNIFGDRNTKELKKLSGTVAQVNDLESSVEALDDEVFPQKTTELKERLQAGESLDDILPEAFALVREAAKRTLGERHYDVQILGGVIMHQGRIAEMRTGEGKTLVATLPAYLNALTGDGVHIVTVNDYLARRDAQWMGQVYAFLGLSVGVTNSQGVSFLYDAGHTDIDEERDELGSFKIFEEFLKPCSRQEAYAADVTYGTNNEFGFDYLRDNLARRKEDLVQRSHHFVIIDEIDSILIDEARTPLIISMPAEESEGFYQTFAKIAETLKPEEDYVADEKMRAVNLTDAGIEKAERKLGVENIYTEKGIKYVHHLETAVRAKALFERDKEYVVKDGEVVIVDQFTGRLQPGRRFSEGLHQALEAKEGVEIKKETKTAASITYQNYFKFYNKLSGMTGTAKTSEEEFLEVYGLDVVVVPTHRPIARIDRNDLIYQTEQGKFRAIARKVKELHEKGQPVLIGTVSIERNELLSAYLKQQGIPHTILNAKNHEHEGQTIAEAGKRGKVTIATNMAGRGVDIKLGGAQANKEEYEAVKSVGGLFVLGTERHEARRIDDQLRGRSGRQGDPGETQFYVSLEDELMRVFGSDRIKSMMGTFGFPEDQPIENRIITNSIKKAQAKIEGFHFDSRKHILSYDNVLSHQREIVYDRRRALLESSQEQVAELFEEITNDRPELEKAVEEKRSEVDDETFFEAVRRIMLHVTDLLWMNHLETMDYLRSSVNLRAYGQRDPLVEYKKEGLILFREMEEHFKDEVLSLVMTINKDAVIAKEEAAQQKLITNQGNRSVTQKVARKVAAGSGSTGEKVGRNDWVVIERDGETKKMKYKKAEPLLESGWKLKEVVGEK